MIDVLSKEARISITELARRVGLSKTPCQARFKRLMDRKILLGFRAVLNANAINQKHVAFTEVKLSDTREHALKAFNEQIRLIPEVEQCHMIAGSFDYLIKVRSQDISAYRKMLGETLSALPYVASTSTYVVMESIKDDFVQ